MIQGGLSWLPTAEYGKFSGLAYYLPMTQSGMTGEVIDLTGDRVIKSPEFTANLTAQYVADTSVGVFTPSITVFHTSDFWFDIARRVTQDAYTTLNVQAAFQPSAMKGLELRVFARNRTNEAYFTSSLLGPTADAPVFSPPRSIGVGASYSF